MDHNTLVPLIVLYTDNRASIDGATRFQKLVFLAQEEGDMPVAYDDFRPDRFGPFSKSLHHDLDVFRHNGLIERTAVTNEYGQEKFIYSLTTKGQQVARGLVDQYGSFFEASEIIKEQFNQEPLPDLLDYVYTKYASYTTATELNVEALFDPDAKSEFEQAPGGRATPPTVAEQLKPTPHTLYQLPKRDTNAYIYYFTDGMYSRPDSKYKELDNQLTLLGRNREQLEVVIVDRDRVDEEIWQLALNGVDVDEYPALIVADRELGIGDISAADSIFTPTPKGEYATIESGILLDDILKDPDGITDFLNALYDAALRNNIESEMRKEKITDALSISASTIQDIISVSVSN